MLSECEPSAADSWLSTRTMANHFGAVSQYLHNEDHSHRCYHFRGDPTLPGVHDEGYPLWRPAERRRGTGSRRRIR